VRQAEAGNVAQDVHVIAFEITGSNDGIHACTLYRGNRCDCHAPGIHQTGCILGAKNLELLWFCGFVHDANPSVRK
jgi:hypothetical protein